MLGSAMMACGGSPAGEVPYGVGSWPEAGRGNHRALVRVEQPADAVWARIPWRRRDPQPETKDVRVFDAATGRRITNVVRIAITPESGDIVFQPVTVPGIYEVYYLPYNPPRGNFDDPGTYFAPTNTADPAWLKRHGLTNLFALSPAFSPSGEEGARRPGEGGRAQARAEPWRRLPQAQLLRIEARGERHRMDPMEVIATQAEIAQRLAAHPQAPYLLFPEDRTNAIRMFETIPLKWARGGPSDLFQGRAQPGEFYPFPIGVWAARAAVSNLTAQWTDLESRSGSAIPAQAMTCFNLEGTDWLGRPMWPSFEVRRGGVRALWFGVQVPANAHGTYQGRITIRPAGLPERTVQVRLVVEGPVLPDGGVSDLWRLSRLKWLNSTLGLEEEVIPPFTPLEVVGDTVRCLLRQVRFDSSGLPASIVAQGRELLSRPLALVVETPQGALVFQPETNHLLRQTPATVERLATARSAAAAWRVESKMEFDGCLSYRASLRAEAPLALKDVRLEIPLRREVAAYMMGMRRRGGLRPKEWRWHWNINRADNQVWLGDVQGGLQLTLPGARDVWDFVTLRDAGLPRSWWNDGRGGCDITEAGDTVLVRAWSGERALAAGEELEFRFRLLITPFKPVDRRHWNWRYGDITGDANILHIHHGAPPNSYINYPFLEADQLAETVRQARAMGKRVDPGHLSYPAAGHWNPAQGALHLWVRVNFDPKAGRARDPRFNQPLFALDFPNQDSLGFYWNIDVRGLRAYVRKGAPSKNQYPSMVDAPAPEWQNGRHHLLTLSWGEQLAIYIDGQRRAAGLYRGLATNSVEGATLNFTGEGFILDGIKVSDQPYSGGALPTREPDAHTLLLDTFAGAEAGTPPLTLPLSPGGGEGSRKPAQAKGAPLGRQLRGTVAWQPGASGRGLHLTRRVLQGQTNGVNLYYTVRELSDHVVELWPLRSLGDEIFQHRETFIYSVEKTTFGGAGGGYPWLREHLVAGYVPAWRQPLPNGDTDAAIATQGLSRWHNYYLEGLRWLMHHTGVDGLYLDGIGYDREIMKRVARVMHRANPGYRINFHSGNNYDFMNWQTSPMNTYMEHLPFISNLWFGEGYDYDRPPDYWLIEISGLPFGLTSEMLNYQNGGNPWRGMIYGMTGRLHPSAPAMWRFWDRFGIQEAETRGYWDPRCPIRTGRDDVLATAYVKPDATLVALASWAKQAVSLRLHVDWAALGLDPNQTRLEAPAIEHFQTARTFRSDDAIPVPPGQGWLLVLSKD